MTTTSTTTFGYDRQRDRSPGSQRRSGCMYCEKPTADALSSGIRVHLLDDGWGTEVKSAVLCKRCVYDNECFSCYETFANDARVMIVWPGGAETAKLAHEHCAAKCVDCEEWFAKNGMFETDNDGSDTVHYRCKHCLIECDECGRCLNNVDDASFVVPISDPVVWHCLKCPEDDDE